MKNIRAYNCSDKSLMEADKASASVIVAHILRLFPESASVVDFGCGPGVFLRQFMQAGLDIRGFESSQETPENPVIPQEKFTRIEPDGFFSSPGKFDLALSLNVADDLQEKQAEALLNSLALSSDIIIFSAAAYDQATDRPVNVRWSWPWISMFRDRGFQCVDILRPLFWQDNRISWQYRQNLLLFMRNEAASRFPQLGEMPSFNGYPLIHPDAYADMVNEKNAEIASLRQALERRAEAIGTMVLAIEKNSQSIAALTRSAEKNTQNIAALSQSADKNSQSIASLSRSAEKNSQSLGALSQSVDKNSQSIAALSHNAERISQSIAALSHSAERNSFTLGQLALHQSGKDEQEKGFARGAGQAGNGSLPGLMRKAILGAHGKIKDTRAWHGFKRAVNKTPVIGAFARKGKRKLIKIIRPQ